MRWLFISSTVFSIVFVVERGKLIVMATVEENVPHVQAKFFTKQAP